MEAKAFRMITLTSFQLKVAERVIQWYLSSKDELRGLISPKQFGFRAGGSTEAAIHQLVWRIEQALENQEYAVGIFLDIEGAFDNATIESIEMAMEDGGIEEAIRYWNSDMLRNREVEVELSGEKRRKRVRKGTPQGGVSSPWMWNLVMNSLLKILEQQPGYSQAFADDLVNLLRGKCIKTLFELAQRLLTVIEQWSLHQKLRLSPKKTEIVVFTRRRAWNPPYQLRIYQQPIQLRQQVRYLGVILNEKLCWKPNCVDRARRAMVSLIQCQRMVGKTWGLSSSKMTYIYKAIIRPMLSYGVIAWIRSTRIATHMKPLERVQRMACLMITAAFPGTATASMEMILGIPPLDIYLETEAVKTAIRLQIHGTWTQRQMIAEKSHVNICNRIIDSVTEMKMPKDSIVPVIRNSRKFSVNIRSREEARKHIQTLESRKAIMCYTDGSRTGNKTGAGFVIQWNAPEIETITHQQYLGNLASVFQAEMVAVDLAVRHMMSEKISGKEIHIFTDNQACLKSLASHKGKSKISQECWEDLNSLAELGNNIKLEWVPGHSGIEGNEEADVAAKAGTELTTQGPEPFLPLSQGCWKRILEDRGRVEAEKRWRANAGYKATKKVLPEGNPALTKNILRLNRSETRAVTQIITGIGNLGVHLSRIGKIQSPVCTRCNYGNETGEHIVEECPALMRKRWESFQSTSVSLADIIKEARVKELARFLLRTMEPTGSG